MSSSFVRPGTGFTLFVHKTDACHRIVSLAQDTNINIVDLQKTKAPSHVQGVPSLCDNNQKTVYQGSDAFRVVNAIRTELAKQVQKPSSLRLMAHTHTATAVPGMQISTDLGSYDNAPIEISEETIEKILKQREAIFEATGSSTGS